MATVSLSDRPIVRFAAVGVLSTLIDIAVLNLLLRAGVHVYLAGALGFAAGFTNGYVLNSRYVFAHASRNSYIRYLLVSLGGLIITELILDFLHLQLGVGVTAAKLVAVGLVFFWNYGLSKVWVFKLDA